MPARAYKAIEAGRLPDTLELLLEGGDARILTVSGYNEYGCRPSPEPELVSFASSTASTISETGFAAADALRDKIAEESAYSLDSLDSICKREFSRIRHEFAALCGIEDQGGLDILFTASGTDAHRLASRLIAPRHIVMVEQAETGRGVSRALAKRQGLCRGEAVTAVAVTPVAEVSIRKADGSPRDAGAIDDEISGRVSTLVKNGARVLLVLVDVSKTGMIAPSLSCAMELKSRFPGSLEILVDACQFRMAASTLKAYLEYGFLVALTGSKFVTGPAFSGALLIPKAVRRLKIPASPAASSRFEGPDRMQPGIRNEGTNRGPLLRWEAALAELRAFRRIPEAWVERFLREFAGRINDRLQTDPDFESLPVPALDRLALTGRSGWDAIQTIFPFRLRRKGRRLGPQETGRIHALLREDLSRHSSHPAASLRCSLGQPVSCGEDGSALRLCAGARLVVEGVDNAHAVISQAFSVLDKVGLLLSLPDAPG